jgi:branched-chain amino acid transport system permease protein
MAAATGVFHGSYETELRLRHTRVEQVRLALAVVVLAVVPFVASAFWLTVAIQVGIAVVGAVGLNILTGYTGQISLGQGGFLAVGAYSSGLLVTRAGLPTLVAVIAAVLITALIGALFGLPALRLKGLYLAIATLAAQQIILWAVRNWNALTGGVDSLFVESPVLFGWTLESDFAWYWVVGATAAVAVITARNLFRTGIGRAFMAIRDQDIAAEAIGVNLTRYKVLAFAVSSAYVGLAGALTAHWTNIVTFERFTLEVSILYLAMIIVGGLGSTLGSVLGAMFMIVVPSLLQQGAQTLEGSFLARQLPAIELFVFGAVIVLFLVLEPRGLARMWQRTKDYFRLWPFRY